MSEMTHEVRDAVAEAAALRLCELVFLPPSAARDPELLALAREMSDATLGQAALAAAQVDGATHVSLFGPGGPVSPREAAYCGRQDPGAVMADVSGFYRAFAYPQPEGEPADHVAVETGFAAFLFLKEAYARAEGDTAAANLVREARGSFVSEHLARLVAGVTARLSQVQAPQLLAVAKLLAQKTGAAAVECEPAAAQDDEVSCCGSAPAGNPEEG